MRRFEIVIHPDGSALSIGGRSAPRQGGDHATARAEDGRLILPASALRGALRLELERLLAGLDPDGRACSANREEASDPDAACDCAVCRIFGESGVAAGRLRLEDAVLSGDAAEAGDVVVTRPRVAVSRRSRTVSEGLLGFLETCPPLSRKDAFRARAMLVPRGASEDELEEDLRNLRAACSALRGIGGSRARGLGWVRCEIQEPTGDAPQEEASGRELSGDSLRLRFVAQAPLHLGLGPPLGYFQPSRRYAPGSAVRGAVAFALLEHGLCEPGDTAFQRLFDAGGDTSFGAARPAGDVPSATRRECRSGSPHVFDDLVAEVLRRQAAAAGLTLAAQHACTEPGCPALKSVPRPVRHGAELPQVRVRTRTALNRHTGTSMDAKLFSHEVLEPTSRDGEDPGREPRTLELVAEVCGLAGAGRRLLASLDGHDVWLGGKRAQGMGRCRLAVEAGEAPEASRARRDIAALRHELVSGWEALRQAAGDLAKDLLGPGEVPVAVVLTEPWTPGDEALPELGPLAEAGPAGELRLLASFVRLAEEGRFGALEARCYAAPPTVVQGEKPPRTVVAPGSTYVVAVAESVLEERLEGWLERGRRGTGSGQGMGWGRFTLRGPESDF